MNKNLPRRLKPYKAADAYDTVERIRQLLNSRSIRVKETYCKDHFQSGTSSCRIVLDAPGDFGKLDIGANGKGMTSAYSLASGYAELMERLQNKFFLSNFNSYFLKKKSRDDVPLCEFDEECFDGRKIPFLDFYDYPDEEKIKAGEYLKRDTPAARYFSSQEAIHRAANGFFSCVPFYNVLSGHVEMLPGDLITWACGSNGLCAGNNPREALIQGICENLERYALRGIFTERLTPPDIPEECFMDTPVMEKITRLRQEYNVSLRIKDFSMGIGLPVIACIFIFHDTAHYSVAVGADPCPITSLERCLTEAYQGISGAGNRKHPLNFHERTELTDEENWLNYQEAVNTGAGKWPESIFKREPDWKFDGFPHPVSNSDEQDLKYLVEFIRKQGWTLYVRDVSFLGFPSFCTYIPGVSETESWDYYDCKMSMELHHFLLNVKTNSEKNLEKLAFHFDKLNNYRKLDISGFFPKHVNIELLTLSSEYFMALLWYRVGHFDKALDYIDEYIRKRQKQKDGFEKQNYMLCMRDFFKMRHDEYSFSVIEEELPKLHGKENANKILDAFSIPANIFNSLNLPACFNCRECPIKSDCRLFEFVSLEKKLQDVQLENPIDQKHLSEVFKF